MSKRRSIRADAVIQSAAGRKTMSIIKIVTAALFLAVAPVCPAKAADGAEGTGITPGEITVRLLEGTEGTVREGIRFFCTKVAEIQNGDYVLMEEYRGSEVDLNEVNHAEELGEAAEMLAEYVKDTGGTAEKSDLTDQRGEVHFTGLEPGVYLIRGEENPAYDVILPALAAVPTFHEVEGAMLYSVEVEPKHTPRPREEKNTAPQTGIDDATFQYLTGGVLCISGALLLILAGKRKKSYER